MPTISAPTIFNMGTFKIVGIFSVHNNIKIIETNKRFQLSLYRPAAQSVAAPKRRHTTPGSRASSLLLD